MNSLYKSQKSIDLLIYYTANIFLGNGKWLYKDDAILKSIREWDSLQLIIETGSCYAIVSTLLYTIVLVFLGILVSFI